MRNWPVHQQITTDRVLVDGYLARCLAQVRFCLESACSDHARCGWSCAAWQHRGVQGFFTGWLLGGPGPPGSQRDDDALFPASSWIRDSFSFLYPVPIEVQVHQPGDDVELLVELLGRAPEGPGGYPVPLDHPDGVLDDDPDAVDLLVGRQLLCGQPPSPPVGVGAAPGRLPYGMAPG